MTKTELESRIIQLETIIITYRDLIDHIMSDSKVKKRVTLLLEVNVSKMNKCLFKSAKVRPELVFMIESFDSDNVANIIYG